MTISHPDRLYAVWTRDGELLLTAPLQVVSRVLGLHKEGEERCRREYNDPSVDGCVLHFNGRPTVLGALAGSSVVVTKARS